MPKYTVTITARITKTIIIDAASENEADATAHDLFNPNDDDTQERYFQDTDSITELKEAP